MIKILFVCLGNICRSPLAHGLMEKLAQEKGLDVFVDSAGLDPYHIGEAPQINSQKVALENGFDISGQRARQFQINDFDEFDYIVGMDHQNLVDLKALVQTPEHEKKIHLLMDFSRQKISQVPDPYGKGIEAYREVYSMIKKGVFLLVQRIS